MKNKAFTLVELLVVIAVISLLSSIIYASVSTARAKAKEAKVQATLKNMVSEAELSFDVNGNYSALETPSTSPLKPFVDSIAETGGEALVVVSGDDTAWAATATIVGSDGFQDYYSVSSSNGNVSEWSAEGDIDGPPIDDSENWADAISSCASYGYRLPNREELLSMFDTHGGNPPGFQIGTYEFYWTSVEANVDEAHVVSSNGATTTWKTNYNYVRCIK